MNDGVAVGDAETRAVDNVVTLFFAALFVDDGDDARAVHGDGSASTAFDVFEVDEFDGAVVARFERGALGNAGGGTADVEGTHGELRAGFADGLRGDDADGFTEFDHAARSEIASIAEGANTAAGFAGEHGADADAFDTRSLHGVCEFFRDFLVHFDDDVRFEVLDLLQGNAANDAVAKRFDFDAGFDDGLDVNAFAGAAIEFVDDDVLRDVDETASQVARVRGLESGVSETLTSAVSGDEILQHGEAFAEVRSDRSLHDFAGGLGHQAAHTGKLANLLFRTAGAGVRHDVDGVDDAFLVVAFERFKHSVRDFFGDVAPEGDDLVVALTVSDSTVEILLLNLDGFLFGVFDKLSFVAGDNHVVDADGDAGLGGIGEAKFLQAVEQNDGALETETKVGVINELLNAFLFEQAVNKRHVRGQV